MNFQCPVNYWITGFREGASSAKKHYFQEFVTVTIPEVPAEEAPVAVRWKPAPRVTPWMYSRFKRSDSGVVGPDGFQHTRWYDGRHWQRLCHGHLYEASAHHTQNKPTPALTPEGLAKLLNDPGYIEHSMAAVVMGLGDEQFEVSRTAGYRDVHSDPSREFSAIRRTNRTEKMNRLEEAVADLISVDGVLHRRSIQPFISVCNRKQQDADTHLDVVIEATPYQFWQTRAQGFPSFPLSEWEAAAAFALGNSSDTGAIRHLEPEVLVEDAIALDCEATTAVGVALGELLASLRLKAPVHGPYPHRNITRAMYSQDLDEQFGLLSAIPVEVVAGWKRADKQKLREALLLLDDRTVSPPVQSCFQSPNMC